MDNKELQVKLEELHAEIERAGNIDEKGRELLRDLGDDIRELLARTEGDQPQPGLLRRLEDSISHLEVTHPTITSTLSQILESLSNAGI